MITQKDFENLSAEFGIEIPMIKALDLVESNGQGFDPKTGKIKIQFEPSYFKNITKLFSGLWSKNKVDVQSKEWEAFNDAFRVNPNAALRSTSIGRMQVMGYHYARLGFNTVGEMWDFAKKSERNQLWLGLKFMTTDPALYKDIRNKYFKGIAYRYNGVNYWIKGYHIKIEKAYNLFKKQ